MALKRPKVALAEGLLTEAVLNHACVWRTAVHEPKLPLVTTAANGRDGEGFAGPS